jgi:hypothetical protein
MLPTRACYRSMEGEEDGTMLGASDDGSYGTHFHAHTWR